MGVPQVVLRKVAGAAILRRIDEHGVTLLCGAPAVVAAVLDAASTWDGPIPGAGRTRIIVAGAPPPTRTIERVETELGWEFIQIYGLTETAPLLTINRGRAEYDELSPSERASKLSRAGAPAVGVRITISEQGEVLARSNVVLAPGAEATEGDLIEHCRSKLAHFKCPTSIEFRDVLARTATGKLQKFKLRAPYWEGRERQIN